MARYKVGDNSVEIKGMLHPAGSEVELLAEEAEPFVSAGQIEAVEGADGKPLGQAADEEHGLTPEEREEAQKKQLQEEADRNAEAGKSIDDADRMPADSGESDNKPE